MAAGGGSSATLLTVTGKSRSQKEVKKAHALMKPTADDWALILKGARVAHHVRGDVIMREGERARQILQVSRGTVRVEKAGANKPLAYLDARSYGGIFGEIVRARPLCAPSVPPLCPLYAPSVLTAARSRFCKGARRARR